MRSFSEFYKIQEARVINANDQKVPLKDNETIRVYHAFNNPQDLYDILKYGTSGKLRAKRIYSYEANNNPKGFFVSIDFKTVKGFGQYIMELHTRVSDLEEPVWPSGSYTVQGEYSKYWDEENPREKGTEAAREKAKQSKEDYIRNSDRPELADSLYNNYEKQALFVGELDANSIRAIWVNKDMKKDGRYSTYDRMSVKEFLKTHPSKPSSEHRFKIFTPREEFDVDVMLKRFNQRFDRMSTDDILNGLKYVDDRGLAVHFWPKQMAAVKKFIKTLK
jgi:hypothetical protein